MKTADSPFYLAINYNRRGEGSVWYKKTPMGVDRIGQIMSRMAKKAGLSGKFSNHSVRRTMCNQLIRAGVHPNLVSQLTGHRNVSSLARYATASIDQQKKMCTILQSNSRPSTTICGISDQGRDQPHPKTHHALTAPPSTSPSSNRNPVRGSSQNMSVRSTEMSASTSSSLLHGIFAGASFSNIGSVNFHVHQKSMN